MPKNLQIITLLTIKFSKIRKLQSLESNKELNLALTLNLVVCHRFEGTIRVEITMPLANIHHLNLFNNIKEEAVDRLQATYCMLQLMQPSQ